MISEKAIISAAHCFTTKDLTINDFMIGLGLHKAYNIMRDPIYQASDLVLHPHFDEIALNHGQYNKIMIFL